MADDAGAVATRAQHLSRRVQALLVGQGPEMQGAVLADLVSIYFAGHHPAIREKMIAMWLDTVRQLIEPSEQEIRARGGYPPGWNS
jgi:hypothetical protein